MAEDSESNRISSTHFAFHLKRRSNPSAAFAELLDGFRSTLRYDGELAQAAAQFKGGVFVTLEDATRLADLEEQGISASEFTISSLPSAFGPIGPGLALMYDTALEVLRSSDRSIRPERLKPRAPQLLTHLVEDLMPLIGSSSVTALEMALKDETFRERLKDRAAELGDTWTAQLDNHPGPCNPQIECEIQREIAPGVWDTVCVPKDQCGDILGIVILLLILAGIAALTNWIIDLFD